MQKIVKVSLVTALSLVGGCGGGDDSNGGGGGGGGGAPLQGNFSFSISECTNYVGGIGAERTGSPEVQQSQLPAIDGTRSGRLLEHGEEGASVECSIDGGMPHSIRAEIRGMQSHPGAQFVEEIGLIISSGSINGAESGGTGEAVITIQTGGVFYRTPAGSMCTLSLDSSLPNNQFSVEAGSIYARFDCPALEDLPTTGCVARGAFVFEGCAKGGGGPASDACGQPKLVSFG